jgi:hypothetical protein
MSNAVVALSPFETDSCAADSAQVIDDAFRARILAAMRDLRARERRASSVDLRPDLRMGDASNDAE